MAGLEDRRVEPSLQLLVHGAGGLVEEQLRRRRTGETRKRMRKISIQLTTVSAVDWNNSRATERAWRSPADMCSTSESTEDKLAERLSRPHWWKIRSAFS